MTTLTSSWQEIYRTSKNTGYGNQYVIFYAYATENIADNSSTIHTLIRTIVEGSGNYVSVSSWDVASDTSSNSGGSTTWYAGNDYNLLESAWTVSHNADGTGSVSIGMAFHATYNITSVDYRVTVDLQTIPRASNVSINKSACTLNGGDGFVIYTNRASTSFSHNLYHNIGGSWVLIASGVGDNYTWIPSTNFYANIGNGSGTYQILCQTYSGSTHIGDSQVNFTINSAGVHQSSLNIGSITLNGSNGVRIYTNRNSGSFLHYIQQNFDADNTFVGINSDYNCSDYLDWTPPVSYYTKIAGGYRTFTIRVHCRNSDGTYLGYTDCSFTIYSAGADAVSLSSSNMTMGTEYTVNISKKVDSFRHTISWGFGTASGTLGTAKAVDTSVVWTPSTDLSVQIPNNMTGVGAVSCQTYYGDTLIGTTTVNFNLSVPNYNVVLDTLTITEEGTDAKTPANNLTTYGIENTEVVAIMSVKRLVVSATTSYNATISNISVTFGSKKLDTSGNTDKSKFNNTFSGMLNGILSITATDSRGRTLASTYSQTYTFRNYFLPSVTAFSGDRTTQTGDKGTLNANGTFWNATAGTTANTLTGAISQSATGSTTIVPKTDNTWSTSFPVSGVTYTNSYDFTITVTDSFGNKATKTYTLPISVPVLWKGKHTVRIRDFLIVNRVIKTAKLVLTEALTGVTATFTGTVTAPTFKGALSGNATTATTSSSCSGNAATATNADTAKNLYGFNSRTTGQGWGQQAGTFVTGFDATNGSDMAIRRDCPTTGQLSIIVDGRFYQNEGQYRCLDTSDILNSIWPVGAIYMSLSGTSPASLFGGTWTQITGVFFYAASSNPGATGGSNTAIADFNMFTAGGRVYMDYRTYNNGYSYTENVRAYIESGDISVASWSESNSGEGLQVHNNGSGTLMPPYMNVYAWRRTA